MTKVKLQEALLRRKELQDKVQILKNFRERDLFELKTGRKPAHEGLDDIIAEVPKLTASQVTAEYDFYARQLRLCDAVIQQANWTTDVDLEDTVMQDYKPPKE
ncbi:MAG: hypothetical protein ACFFG0_03570 [Candidatus Thorarchaeota archaeon]